MERSTGRGGLGRMRREWRKVLAFGVLFLASVGPDATPQDVKPAGLGPGPAALRLTIEVNWGYSGDRVDEAAGGGAGSRLSLELSEGRVVEARAWPPRPPGEAADPPGWGPAAGGCWRMGDGPEGRARARIEAPLEAKLIVRRGGRAVSVPLVAVLERPQHTPLAVAVERLPWDTLGVELGATADGGIVAPGAKVPVSIAFNVLWPEPTDVTVRYSAALRSVRSGEIVTHQDRQDVLPTNRREPPVRLVELAAPRVEGAYVLEVQAAWEPLAREGSRLGRLIRRRKPATATTSSVRRLSLVVIDPARRSTSGPRRPDHGPAAGPGHRGETEVDAVDLSRPRIHRPVASGRSPLAEAGDPAWAVPAAALIEPTRRDRLRDWFQRPGAEADRLGPVDAAGLAWSAVGLKVIHP